jgi:hypothetical protein
MRSLLKNKNIKNFIDEDVVINLLKRYISATNQEELRKRGSLEKLILLVRETFKIHWRGKNIEQVKTLDNITKNIYISSRSGKNIFNTLNIK